MTHSLTDLINLIQVERLDKFLFRGRTPKSSFQRIYGGQVIAQAMNAAARTVTDDRITHSLHAYFLRIGNPKKPIIYEVDPIRDGNSFSTRRVVAKQDGNAIFNCSMSFQVTEDGFDHQSVMPDLPHYDSLTSVKERLSSYPPKENQFIFGDPAMFGAWDIRCTHYPEPDQPETILEDTGMWLKLENPIPDNPALHQALIAYISDFNLATAASNPHPVNIFSPGLTGASLDHAIWFHQPCRVDQWLLYAFDSPRATGGRGLSRGSLYSEKGELMVSTAQEALMRIDGRHKQGDSSTNPKIRTSLSF